MPEENQNIEKYFKAKKILRGIGKFFIGIGILAPLILSIAGFIDCSIHPSNCEMPYLTAPENAVLNFIFLGLPLLILGLILVFLPSFIEKIRLERSTPIIKEPLPRKTRTTALIMIILGFAGIIFNMFVFLASAFSMSGGPTISVSLGLIFFLSIIFLVFSPLVLWRKKLPWILITLVILLFYFLVPINLFGYQCDSIPESSSLCNTPINSLVINGILNLLIIIIIPFIFFNILKEREWAEGILFRSLIIWAIFLVFLIIVTPTVIGRSHYFALSDVKFGFFISLIVLLPLRFLLMDRKNFWKIARWI